MNKNENINNEENNNSNIALNNSVQPMPDPKTIKTSDTGSEIINTIHKTELIKDLICKTGLNLKAFAIHADIPYTTLRSILERGIENSSVNNVLKICSALDLTIEELFNMPESTKSSECAESNNSLSHEQTSLLKEFDNLNELGKKEALKRMSELNMIPYYSK